MALPWFKVMADMVDHPKVIDLQARTIEPMAGWWAIRLWAWCSKYCPTGRIPKDHIRSLEGYVDPYRRGNHQVLSKMEAAGLLDFEGTDCIVHDWDEIQGPHLDKAETDALRKRERRAPGAQLALAGSASGAGRVEEKRVEEKREREDPAALMALWNEKAHQDLPRWSAMNKKRERLARDRLKERPIDQWEPIFERLNASAFLRGNNDRGWRAHPEWLLRDGTILGLLEGKYDDKPNGGQTAAPTYRVLKDDEDPYA